MSRLSEIEDALVARLTAAVYMGSPLFATVRGASGGFRRGTADAFRREVMPAAHVAFLDEDTGPSVSASRRGPRFSVVIGARTLRQDSDPRHGSDESPGAFTLLEQARVQLDGFEPVTDFTAVSQKEKFVEADDRVAVYELSYRIQPVVEEILAAGPPEGLAATVGGPPGDVRLSWKPAKSSPTADAAVFYKVYRRRPGEAGYSIQDAVSVANLWLTLASQPGGELLQYHVTGVNSGGESGPSNVASAMV